MLENKRGISVIQILTNLFERVLKLTISPTVKDNISKFLQSQVKGGSTADNFCFERFDTASLVLKSKVWITFCDVGKCFDSLAVFTVEC